VTIHDAQPDLSGAHPFAALGLAAPFVRAVAAEGYSTPTPIQAQAITHVLAGRDVLGCAQTGTGKTAAFVLPLLQRLSEGTRTGRIRALVVAPTRELAAQIGERAAAYGRNTGLRHVVIYGGVGQRAQEIALSKKPDVLIATPGRLLDLIEQRFVDLSGVELLVLDEADRMLDMGFIHDVRRIVAVVPKTRQTLLFSATIPAEIASLVASILRDPVRIDVAPKITTAEKIEQCVYFVARADKRALLTQLLETEGAERSIVFTRTKHGANRLAEQLTRAGTAAQAIHGNKSQSARERALEDFKNGRTPVLVATDLAARGIDVDGITHVFNFDLPNVAESYVHRIGRTARAGAAGKAIAFCDAEERPLLRDIERFIKKRIPVVGSDALGSGVASALPAPSTASGQAQQGHHPDAPMQAKRDPRAPAMPGDSTRPRRARRYRGARF